MRTAFIQELLVQARKHPEIFLVVGDLGYSVVEPFAAEFPSRFLNAGVAEQNMTGVAAGLASEGFHVFTYSIANFPTFRCLEQIRNDICYHKLPVTVVAVGAGRAYGNLGYSHHAVQDIGVMATLPDLTLLSPADPGETRECVTWLAERPGPSYLRLGKAGEANLHEQKGIDKAPLCIRDGDGRLALAATGSILRVALEAAELIDQEQGGRTAVFSCPWLKPAPTGFFQPLFKHARVIAVEEHVSEGGLAALLRMHLPPGRQLSSVCVLPASIDAVGGQEYLRSVSGLTAENLARMARDVIPAS